MDGKCETTDGQCKKSGSCCKCIGKILIFLLGVVVTILAIAATKPDQFYVERSGVAGAPSAVVFEKVNNLQNWNSFSPWAKLDPNAKVAFEGPQAGEGAIFKWDGDKNVGAGMMTIVESKPNELVKFRLDFVRPFEGSMMAEFKFHPDSAGTFVTWNTYGPNTFFSKIMSVFWDCNTMMGGFLEQGLANLDAVSKGQ